MVAEDNNKQSPGFIVLGVTIAILGALTVISATYNQYEDARQDREARADRDCMRDQIQEIVDALQARNASSKSRGDEEQKLLNKLANSPLLQQDPSDYNREQDEFEAKKQTNKYPNGECLSE